MCGLPQLYGLLVFLFLKRKIRIHCVALIIGLDFIVAEILAHGHFINVS